MSSMLLLLLLLLLLRLCDSFSRARCSLSTSCAAADSLKMYLSKTLQKNNGGSNRCQNVTKVHRRKSLTPHCYNYTVREEQGAPFARVAACNEMPGTRVCDVECGRGGKAGR